MRWLVFALLVACVDVEDPPGPTRRFIGRPVLVLVSSELPEACHFAFSVGGEFYRARGVSMLVVSGDPPLGVARASTVAVRGDTLSMTPGRVVHAETRHALTVNGDIFGAEILVASCDERVVAHELGHALGLVDTDVPGELMNGELGDGGWELSTAQLDWIAD